MIVLKKLNFEVEKGKIVSHFSTILKFTNEMVKKYVNEKAIPYLDVQDSAVPYFIHIDDLRSVFIFILFFTFIYLFSFIFIYFLFIFIYFYLFLFIFIYFYLFYLFYLLFYFIIFIFNYFS